MLWEFRGAVSIPEESRRSQPNSPLAETSATISLEMPIIVLEPSLLTRGTRGPGARLDLKSASALAEGPAPPSASCGTLKVSVHVSGSQIPARRWL